MKEYEKDKANKEDEYDEADEQESRRGVIKRMKYNYEEEDADEDHTQRLLFFAAAV